MQESLILKKLKLFFKISITLTGVLSNHQTKLNIVLEVTGISEVFFIFPKSLIQLIMDNQSRKQQNKREKHTLVYILLKKSDKLPRNCMCCSTRLNNRISLFYYLGNLP